VNQADRDGAGAIVRELREMLHLGAARAHDPPILRTTATEQHGIPELWAAIEEHRAWLDESGALEQQRRNRLEREVESLAAERLRGRLEKELATNTGLAAELVSGRIDPYAAARSLIRRVLQLQRLAGSSDSE
jgi:GTPase